MIFGEPVARQRRRSSSRYRPSCSSSQPPTRHCRRCSSCSTAKRHEHRTLPDRRRSQPVDTMHPRSRYRQKGLAAPLARTMPGNSPRFTQQGQARQRRRTRPRNRPSGTSAQPPTRQGRRRPSSSTAKRHEHRTLPDRRRSQP